MLLEYFDIEFVKFKNGTHEFDYLLSSAFFQMFENSSLDSGNVRAKVLFEKQTHALTFNFSLMGNIVLSCDRCLNKGSYPIENSLMLHVKITENTGEEEENLTYIHPGEYKFNVAKYLYELICLAIPMRKTCEDIGEKCDTEVLLKLQEQLVTEDDNEEANDEEKPEWNKLKDILNNLK